VAVAVSGAVVDASRSLSVAVVDTVAVTVSRAPRQSGGFRGRRAATTAKIERRRGSRWLNRHPMNEPANNRALDGRCRHAMAIRVPATTMGRG
jgi:hypothetical protein